LIEFWDSLQVILDATGSLLQVWFVSSNSI
jgi:hypothetical protein